MSEGDWHDVVEEDRLVQGDILKDCPVFSVAEELSWPLPDNSELPIKVEVRDLIVLSQSCDLENDKVDEVLLAPVNAWNRVVEEELLRGNQVVKSRKFREKLVEGNVPGFSLLHKRDGIPSLPWSVVDFHQLFTLPKAFLTQQAESAGPRLRLNSPYREHLAQAFARFFMRIGLPHAAKEFISEEASQ